MNAITALRQATREAHAETEELVDRDLLLSQNFSPERYCRLMQANRQAWEASFRMILRCEHPPGFGTELATLRELGKSLGLLVAEEDGRAKVDQDGSGEAADFAGAVYVLLGSTLGSKVIYRTLEKNPAIAPHQNLEFYRRAAAVSPQAFRETLEKINRLMEDDPATKDRVIRSALNVFGYFRLAYEKL